MNSTNFHYFTARTIDEMSIDNGLDHLIRALLVTCFPKDADTFRLSRGWHGSMPAYSVLLEEDSSTRLIAHASVVDRVIAIDANPIRVAGVQNVCVAPDHRSRRLVDVLMDLSIDEARRRGFDVAMLFCLPALCPIYARLGWTVLSGRTFIKRGESGIDEPLALTDAAMIYPLARQAIPAGVIHLAGNDW